MIAAMNPTAVLPMLWLAWWVSWTIAARWSSTPIRVAGDRLAWLYRASMYLGIFLVLYSSYGSWAPRLWHSTPAEGWLIDLLALAGFAFCWWARLHLGRLWSSAVTIKPEHRIVESGPYGLVRHPIYSGLLLAILASVLLIGTLAGIIGGAIMLAAMVLKARLEEATLREALGRDAYDAYAERVPMLIPFLRIGRQRTR